MDPKTGAVAEIPKEVPSQFSGPHVPTSDDVKKDPKFLAREEIARRANAIREEEQTSFKPDVLGDDGSITPAEEAAPKDDAEPHIEGQPETEAAIDAEQAGETEKEVQPEDERELIVDGKRVKVPLSKIIDAGTRTLQKEVAADQRLTEATELLRQAREQQQRPSIQDAAPVREESHVAQPSQEDAALAHAIQFGTEDQAREAIAKLRVSGRGMSDDQLHGFVQKTLQASIPDQIAFHTANRQIRTDYKEIFGDPMMEQLFMMEETKARSSGDRRAYDELYKDIAGQMVTRFKLRGPEVSQPNGTPIQGRIARKSAAPRPASSANVAAVAQEAPKRPMTTQEYVESQRQRRGLQPLNRH